MAAIICAVKVNPTPYVPSSLFNITMFYSYRRLEMMKPEKSNLN
jgi:hypothetical protein